MAKCKERLEAQSLRRQGFSIRDIAKALQVSRSSASMWVRDVELTDTQIKQLHQNKIAGGSAGRAKGALKNRENKEARILNARQEAQDKIQCIDSENLYFLGLGLYWGEGAKASDGMTAVSNSDPAVIITMMRWFEECWGIDTERFRPRIYINDTHRDREEVLLTFWSQTLKLPKSQFDRTIFLPKGKKIYENHDLYYGVLTLKISKGAELRHKILADIDRVRQINQKPA